MDTSKVQPQESLQSVEIPEMTEVINAPLCKIDPRFPVVQRRMVREIYSRFLKMFHRAVEKHPGRKATNEFVKFLASIVFESLIDIEITRANRGIHEESAFSMFNNAIGIEFAEFHKKIEDQK